MAFETGFADDALEGFVEFGVFGGVFELRNCCCDADDDVEPGRLVERAADPA